MTKSREKNIQLCPLHELMLRIFTHTKIKFHSTFIVMVVVKEVVVERQESGKFEFFLSLFFAGNFTHEVHVFVSEREGKSKSFTSIIS